MADADRVSEGLEELAALVSTGQPGSEGLARDVLKLLADSLEADAIIVCRYDTDFVVERIHDRVGLGVEEGDTFSMQDQHIRTPSDEDTFAHFESLLLAGRAGLRSCTGVPLFRTDGRRYGRLCAVYSRAHLGNTSELTLLRLGARIIVEVIEAAEWKHQALHDPLTGLPNRTLLQDRLDQAISLAQRERSALSVLLIDLDGFKNVNDTYGHRAGDSLLAQVGPRIRRLLRESDTVSRLGGDEFVILLPGVDPNAASLVARKVLRALRHPFAVESHRMGIWASIGIAVYPDHGQVATELMQRADAAMYAAKRHEGGFALASADETPFGRESLRTPHARQS